MKKVLIVGANSYLAKSFVQRYDKEFAFTLLKRDEHLRDYFDLEGDDFRGFDTVINFAAIVHNKKADASRYRRYNFELVKHLATLAKREGIGQFVQISTIAVYGDNSFIDHNTTPKPNNAYGRYKLKADHFLQTLADETFVVSIVRPPVIYGKDAPGNMRTLFKLIGTGFALPLGYEANRRSILCIDNFAEALKRIVRQNSGGILLLRDRDMPSIAALARAIRDAQNAKTAILPVPDFILRFLQNRFSAAKKLFGDLIIDDSATRAKIGEYNLNSWRKSIEKMV